MTTAWSPGASLQGYTFGNGGMTMYAPPAAASPLPWQTKIGGGEATLSPSGSASTNDLFQKYLNEKGPEYAAPANDQNRFETGLASSERRLNALLDDPSAIQQTAAYKFRLGQGEEALQRQQAAKGMLGSGNRLMELTKYGQDMASQEYDNQASRLQNLLGTYAGNWNQAQTANLQNAANVFQTQTGAHTARGNTLANLLGTQYSADRQAESQLKAQQMKGDWTQGWAHGQSYRFNKNTGELVYG